MERAVGGTRSDGPVDVQLEHVEYFVAYFFLSNLGVVGQSDQCFGVAAVHGHGQVEGQRQIVFVQEVVDARRPILQAEHSYGVGAEQE
ncbi:hypothetical protein BpHYR1_038977 [Brachionus plicatilis]|uniref:Uncharacterized protein n=1 Tax=Brachionus plicatilis TaxID=10195 RepID=A0A3M7SGT3_BRAPC|nr:hypothetical protein BpHYR1_038977 [Brachionus plicatilis]